MARNAKTTRQQTLRALAFAGLLLGISTAPFASESLATELGDRLVVAVNGVPYTQRQVEIYIHVKESLRKTNGPAPTRVIVAENWDDALTVFSEDMVIMQEAQRLGTFQAPDQALDKYLAVVREKIAKGEALRATLDRLGAPEPVVGHALEDVLRVAAFRRSKSHQEQEKAEAKGPPKWLQDLEGRAVIRRYKGAEKYEMIYPSGKS